MKSKIFTQAAMAVLVIVLATALVAALTLSVTSSPQVLSHSNDMTTFTVSDLNNGINTFTLSQSDPVIADDDNNEVQLLVVESTSTADSVTYDVEVTNIDEDFNIGTYSTTILVNANDGIDTDAQEVTLEFEGSYCDFGEQGNYFEISDLQDEELDNTDEWEWRPLDKIEIILEVENEHDDDLDDLVVEYGIWDTRENDFVFDDDMDIKVDEDERDEFTIEFMIDPEDLNEDTDDGDYLFVVKVYDDDEGEDQGCVQQFESLEIARERDEIKLDVSSVNVLPETLMCAATAEVSATIYNVGTDDQEDVVITLVNAELDIEEVLEVGDIDSGDSESIRFTLDIPADADEKRYPFTLRILDEDGDVYELEDHDGDDYDAVYTIFAEVDQCGDTGGNGGNGSGSGSAVVTASLVSGGIAGEQLVVRTTIANTGSSTDTYFVEVSDVDGWATVESIDPSAVAVSPGSSKDVTITLKVNDGIEGDQRFNIDVTSSDTNTPTRQPVEVTIESKPGAFSGFGSAINSGNWYLWGIGLLNVILVVIIVIVAVRIARS